MSRAGLVVLSGGLDSTVCMAIAARDTGTAPVAVTFDYGQRTRIEIERAGSVARWFGAEHLVVPLDTRPWGGSALVDTRIDIPVYGAGTALPEDADVGAGTALPDDAYGTGIPVTYVPARNIIFLAVALGIAEARDLEAAYIGVNAIDYSGYPDCRPEFLDAFRAVAAIGQKRGVEGDPVAIRAPLISMTKGQIVATGTNLGAPLELTWSCYSEGPEPCGYCESCVLRAKGFADAGIADPAGAGAGTPVGSVAHPIGPTRADVPGTG